MAAGDTYKPRYLDAAYGSGRAAAFPATVYVEVYTAAPTSAGGGTVVVGGGYAPVAVTNNDTNFAPAAGTGNIKKNATLVAFPVATANYPAAVTHVAIKDAVGGAIIDFGALTTPVTVLAGQQLVFQPNNFTMSVV